LTELLAGDYTVVAPDLYGYGTSPDWTQKRALELEDEIDLLGPVLERIPGPFHLIGHSYGAAVAFKLARTMPARVRSLVVYEPVLFNLLFEADDLDAATEIWMVSDDVHRLLVDNRLADAARRFIDYWSGEGVWNSLPEWQREKIKGRMKKVQADFDATMGNPTPLTDYRKLNIPLLLLYGLQSPLSTRQIAEWLTRELPNAEVRGLLPLGHMGPVTHAEAVNRLITSFLKKQPTGILPHQIRRPR
jgi:pimeloyl-ACP methyl ester carboxylesterase